MMMARRKQVRLAYVIDWMIAIAILIDFFYWFFFFNARRLAFVWERWCCSFYRCYLDRHCSRGLENWQLHDDLKKIYTAWLVFLAKLSKGRWCPIFLKQQQGCADVTRYLLNEAIESIPGLYSIKSTIKARSPLSKDDSKAALSIIDEHFPKLGMPQKVKEASSKLNYVQQVFSRRGRLKWHSLGNVSGRCSIFSRRGRLQWHHQWNVSDHRSLSKPRTAQLSSRQRSTPVSFLLPVFCLSTPKNENIGWLPYCLSIHRWIQRAAVYRKGGFDNKDLWCSIRFGGDIFRVVGSGG